MIYKKIRVKVQGSVTTSTIARCLTCFQLLLNLSHSFQISRRTFLFTNSKPFYLCWKLSEVRAAGIRRSWWTLVSMLKVSHLLKIMKRKTSLSVVLLSQLPVEKIRSHLGLGSRITGVSTEDPAFPLTPGQAWGPPPDTHWPVLPFSD